MWNSEPFWKNCFFSRGRGECVLKQNFDSLLCEIAIFIPIHEGNFYIRTCATFVPTWEKNTSLQFCIKSYLCGTVPLNVLDRDRRPTDERAEGDDLQGDPGLQNQELPPRILIKIDTIHIKYIKEYMAMSLNLKFYLWRPKPNLQTLPSRGRGRSTGWPRSKRKSVL